MKQWLVECIQMYPNVILLHVVAGSIQRTTFSNPAAQICFSSNCGSGVPPIGPSFHHSTIITILQVNSKNGPNAMFPKRSVNGQYSCFVHVCFPNFQKNSLGTAPLKTRGLPGRPGAAGLPVLRALQNSGGPWWRTTATALGGIGAGGPILDTKLVDFGPLESLKKGTLKGRRVANWDSLRFLTVINELLCWKAKSDEFFVEIQVDSWSRPQTQRQHLGDHFFFRHGTGLYDSEATRWLRRVAQFWDSLLDWPWLILIFWCLVDGGSSHGSRFQGLSTLWVKWTMVWDLSEMGCFAPQLEWSICDVLHDSTPRRTFKNIYAWNISMDNQSAVHLGSDKSQLMFSLNIKPIHFYR